MYFLPNITGREMWDLLCFLLLVLNISFSCSKTQLFTLKDKRIVGEPSNAEEQSLLLEDEVFFIISQASTQRGSSSFELAFDPTSVNSHRNSSGGAENNSKQSSIEDYDVLDCGKPVQKTTFDELMGIIHRKKHKSLPEPDVFFTFTKKKGGKNFDVDSIEMKLRKDKRDKPRSVQLYNKIGNFWRIKGNALISIECFRKALSLNPSNSEVILNLARVLYHQGYLEDAIYLTRKSLEVHSADKSAWKQYFTLGLIFKKYGNIQESILHLRHALELSSSPHHDKILQSLEELEKIPISSLHFYTILIILFLVLGVLIVMRYHHALSQNDGAEEPKRDKTRCFKFRGAMTPCKVRVIRRK